MAKGVRVSAQLRREAVGRILAGEALTKVAADVGVPFGTVAGWVPTRGSKRKLLDAVIRRGRTDDIRELAMEVGMDPHSAVHQLWAMQKQNLVTFREQKQANGHTALINVQPGKAITEALAANPTAAAVVAIKGDPVAEMLDAHTADPVVQRPQSFPLMSALRAKHQRLEKLAAEAEEMGEDDLALHILNRLDKLSPLEAEYLAYVKHIEEGAAQ